MSSNPDWNKQAKPCMGWIPVKKIIFSHKIKELLSFVFKHSNALKAYSQKHLGITLDFKLPVKEHLNNVLKKLTKQ